MIDTDPSRSNLDWYMDFVAWNYNQRAQGDDPLMWSSTEEVSIEEDELPAPEFLVRIGFAESNSRARQLLKDGIVSIGGNSVRDGVYLRDPKYLVYIYDGMVARLGKKNIKKFVVVNRNEP